MCYSFEYQKPHGIDNHAWERLKENIESNQFSALWHEFNDGQIRTIQVTREVIPDLYHGAKNNKYRVNIRTHAVEKHEIRVPSMVEYRVATTMGFMDRLKFLITREWKG